MDIKFHVSKIIDSGSNVNDWVSFVDQVKNRCDRDILAQIYTVALNNIAEKRTKEYKKLMIGLGNLQSETSPEVARSTFEAANGLDTDCAVVCVYYAQFEYRHDKNLASKILVGGKFDGRTPKVLIKMAYKNLRAGKANLLDGIIDPWDEALHDVTDTATFTQTNKEPKSPTKTGIKQLHITRSLSKLSSERAGKPVRVLKPQSQSASGLCKSIKYKSPTEDLKDKLSKVVDLDLKTNANKLNETPDSGVFDGTSKIDAENKENIKNKDCIASLSPFMKNCIDSPLVKRNGMSFFETTPSDILLFSFNTDSNESSKLMVKKNPNFKTPFNASSSLQASPDDAYNSGNAKETNFINNRKPLNESEPIKTPLKKLRYSDSNSSEKNNKSPKQETYALEEEDQALRPTLELDVVASMKDGENMNSKKSKGQAFEKETLLSENSIDIEKLLHDNEKGSKPGCFIENNQIRKSSYVQKQEDCPDVMDVDAQINEEMSKDNNGKMLEMTMTESNSSSKLHMDVSNNTKLSIGVTSEKLHDISIEITKSKFNDSLTIMTEKKSFSGSTASPKLTAIAKGTLQSSEKENAIECVAEEEKSDSVTAHRSVSKTDSANRTNNNYSDKARGSISEEKVSNNTIPEILGKSQSNNSDYNYLIATGLEMLNERGFDMNPVLRKQPVKATKKFSVNGKLYAQLKCIGKGGSCKVFEVLGQDGRIYALKRVKLQNLDKFMMEMYMNEIKWLEKLKGSPFIIELFEWEKTEDNLLIVLEKGDCDLAHVLKESKKLDLVKLKTYWKQMLSAVNIVHEVGIVHADLKPANFLFVGPVLKLIDFGIANGIQAEKTSVTRENQVGTLNFMPPEALVPDALQANGFTKISRASDVWSLGCMLYLMVFRKTPYQHITNSSSKMLAIQQGQQISFKGIEDLALMDCLQGCLKYNKRDRYTIKQLLNHRFLEKV